MGVSVEICSLSPPERKPANKMPLTMIAEKLLRARAAITMPAYP